LRTANQTSARLSRLDRLTLTLAPEWTLRRVRARAAARTLTRHYEAAQPGRRTAGWARSRGDANAMLSVALAELRLHARDLVRNNGWAKKAQRTIANHTTGGWGLTPRPAGREATAAAELWRRWADTTECHSERRLPFSGIQHLVMRSLASDGEVLIRRRLRRTEDGLAVPLQLQVLEADFIDSSKEAPFSAAGGPIVQGVEFDLLGRRAAYWLFSTHPGSTNSAGVSKRVPASELLHVFYVDRPGQVRGASWFGAGIVPLKDLDDYEDADLMKQKIAACFAAFVTDLDGAGSPLGETSESDPLVETLEPGMIVNLPPGKSVAFGNPPTVTDDRFTLRNLRKVAASLLVTYEDLTGDYSQVNFSSARMARLSHWGNVRDWQWNLLVPSLCQGVWSWAMEAAVLAGAISEAPSAEWTAPPMPMIEPDKEGLAYSRLVRNGVMTHAEMVREQGGDPETHWREYAEGLKKLDALGIVLDSDVRAVSAAGLTQERVGG
jgi:lambda family phage portal protein